jgi:hypothetical protein
MKFIIKLVEYSYLQIASRWHIYIFKIIFSDGPLWVITVESFPRVIGSITWLFFYFALQPNSGLGRLHETFRFTSVTRSTTVGRTPWKGDHLVARSLPVHKHRKTHTQHKHKTSMPRVGFERTVPASARAKTVHALDGSATVTGIMYHSV